jgi:SAM-dependent methyltransferase
MPPGPASDGAWWERAFGPAYLAAYPHRGDEEARRHAPVVASLIALRAGDRVLDLACGEGRYARALAAAGMRVTGVDLSEDLLAVARRASPSLPGAPCYLRCDMRRLPFEQQFEGAVSLFTSFGYFDRAEDDARVLEGVHRALVPGGRFLLDFLHAAAVRATLEPRGESREGPWAVHASRRLDEGAPGGPRVRKDTEVRDARTGRVVWRVEESVRLYAPEELDGMLRAAGLEPEGGPRGGLDGRPFDAASPRWVRVARRRGGAR